MDALLPARSDDYLRSLAKYGILTAEQVTRLHHKMGSWKLVQKRLRQLSGINYVAIDRRPRGEGNPDGALLHLYRLHDLGKKYVRTLKIDPRRVELPGTAFHIDHRLEVNDFLIAVELLLRDHPELDLTHLEMESELHKDYFATEIDGQRFAVIPDAFVVLSDANGNTPISLEIDRGTEEEKHWRHRVAAMVPWLQGPYQNRFGTNTLNIAVIVTKGNHGSESPERRAQRLIHWTEQELIKRDAERFGPIFKIAPVKPGDVDPDYLFFENLFAQPFARKEYAALLEK